MDIKGNILSFSINDKNWSDAIPLNSIKNIRYYKPSRYWIYNFFRKRKHDQKEVYTLEFILKDKSKYKVLITKKILDRIKKETNLLQRFDKAYLASSTFNQKIEQHI